MFIAMNRFKIVLGKEKEFVDQLSERAELAYKRTEDTVITNNFLAFIIYMLLKI